MPNHSLCCLAVFLFGGCMLAQEPPSATRPEGAPIIQPGAPGKSGRVLSPMTAAPRPNAPHEADVKFMQGMIMHHSQAVEMTELLRTRTATKTLQAFGRRISISQTDEIEYMKQWLRDRGQAESMAGHEHMDHSQMRGGAMGHMQMGPMEMMPGMLTPPQMKALAKARGRQFDYLFLTGMIQHHNGALIMVEDLFATPGAGQDSILFDFATDIDNTQRAEIGIMQNMLKEKK